MPEVFKSIPVVSTGPGDGLTGQAPAVLREVLAGLQALVETGASASIDLRGLPLSRADRAWLRAQLGQGEVRALVDAGGESRIEETAFSGVWWVEHDDETGALMGLFIEITRVPELLLVHPDDLEIGLKHLESRIDDLK